MWWSRGIALAALVLVAGCTVGPSYRTPAVAAPAAYSSGAAADADISHWWTAFDDPVLSDLIARAESANLDVRQAAARIAEARADEQATRAAGGPTVNASAQASETRLSTNALPAALASLGTGAPSGAGGIGLPGETFPTYQTGFDASWELDLFGGQRRANEAAGARRLAAVWSKRDAEVTLAAEVANTYEQYRALHRRIAIADETLAADRELLAFIQARTEHGLVTTLDERRQQSAVDQLAAEREDLAAQAGAHVHALSVLLALAPTALADELATPSAVARTTIVVPVGLPSELLQRRPDVRAAERRLAAATADIGVATADLYPKLSLTGALQLASRSLTTLIETDSITANGSARISVPILGREVAHAHVRYRQAATQEALLAYQKDVLTALKDVEDALTRLDADQRRVETLRAAERAARDAADTTEVRYRNGLITYIDVLQARETALNASDARVQAEAAAAQDVVALYKALGGGWDGRRVQADEEAPVGRGG